MANLVAAERAVVEVVGVAVERVVVEVAVAERGAVAEGGGKGKGSAKLSREGALVLSLRHVVVITDNRRKCPHRELHPTPN